MYRDGEGWKGSVYVRDVGHECGGEKEGEGKMRRKERGG